MTIEELKQVQEIIDRLADKSCSYYSKEKGSFKEITFKEIDLLLKYINYLRNKTKERNTLDKIINELELYLYSKFKGVE